MDTKYPFCKPEVWGGIECTINRVNGQYRDQLQMAGHYQRPGDIERFASLGIKRLRYPVLWERHQKKLGQKIDWKWMTQQLDLIRHHNMVPIAGLLHHGSGPVFTDLTDEAFPEKFAAYAAQVALQFPWIEHYTPVNEPLTTARFSGLYGFWFPHCKSELIFFRMLLNQVKATVLAMQAIRKENPKAQLIPTEDLAKIHSTPLLKYQAEFENQRRWLTYDLLCGRLDKKHFFWKYLLRLGISRSSLEFFLENPCPPSVLGFNYYVTSERYLDQRIKNYPIHTHGGNGKHNYADVEAVRKGKQDGIQALLREAWDRYGLPLAITECHLSCTREEQLRWLKETYEQCAELTKEGIDIKAVTAWSLLGAYDWNSLLTCNNGHYEPGVFDCSSNKIRMTSIGKMIKGLAGVESFDHPLIKEKGWWHHPRPSVKTIKQLSSSAHPILIIGKTGTLGNAFKKICEQRSIPFIALGREDINILDRASINSTIQQLQPWAIVNASGYVRVDDAETDADTCMAVNAEAPALMAAACRDHGVRFMSFSSDLVFDGNKKSPYHERDAVLPLNIYGFSKARGEELILREHPSSLIIRSSAFFGPWDRYNFVHAVLESIKNKETFYMPNDVTVSPTYVPDLCHTAMDLFIDEEEGVWHLSNEGMITWAGFGDIIAARTGNKKNRLISRPVIEMGWMAKRPLYSVLESHKGVKLPPLENALDRYFDHRAV